MDDNESGDGWWLSVFLPVLLAWVFSLGMVHVYGGNAWYVVLGIVGPLTGALVVYTWRWTKKER